MKRYRTWILATPIALVDAASASNVYAVYRYGEGAYTAALVAIAYAALQGGALFLYSQPLADSTRRWLLWGAAMLLGVTGLANVAMTYEQGSESYPARALAPAFGFGNNADGFMIATAWVLGLTLVCAGLIFWRAFGEHVRQQEEEKGEVQEALRAFLKHERSQ